jgi:hypothetical protein
MFRFPDRACVLPQGWIGGWLLPQEASYFAIALPHGWWLFGLDLALDHDIDMCQTRCVCRALRFAGFSFKDPAAAVLHTAPQRAPPRAGAPAGCVRHVPMLWR